MVKKNNYETVARKGTIQRTFISYKAFPRFILTGRKKGQKGIYYREGTTKARKGFLSGYFRGK
tara:strand:+ start:490 stop:678 length:189 start_codon:yes stop_codon:yes gene_type:complete